jgi:hypothetical protein
MVLRLHIQYVFMAAGFEVFTALTMKYAAFWDVALCGSCKN